MKNIRKQTYSLEQYLKLMKDETIRTDQECQRLSGQWNPNMVNELIATVLTDNYIPPIILGEETVRLVKAKYTLSLTEYQKRQEITQQQSVSQTKDKMQIGLSEIRQPSKERRVDYGLCTHKWKILYKNDRNRSNSEN